MENIFVKLISFGLIGAFNTVFDIVIWKSIVFYIEALPESDKTQNIITQLKKNIYLFAQIIAFILALSLSFILNSNITWARNNTNYLTIINFFLVSIFTWLVCTTYLNFLTQPNLVTDYDGRLDKFYQKYIFKYKILKLTIDKFEIDYPLLIKISSIGISLLFNFIGYNYIVFR
jgi:putative flippase GtrA